MNTNIRTILFLIFCFTSFLANSQQSLYVSTNGSGTVFSKEQPGNVEALTSKIREMREKASGTINVCFGEGEYQLSKPLIITDKET